jgi:hypothetical protein
MIRLVIILLLVSHPSYAGWFGKSDKDLAISEVSNETGFFGGRSIEAVVTNKSSYKEVASVWLTDSKGNIICASKFLIHAEQKVKIDMGCDALEASPTFHTNVGWLDRHENVSVYAKPIEPRQLY